MATERRNNFNGALDLTLKKTSNVLPSPPSSTSSSSSCLVSPMSIKTTSKINSSTMPTPSKTSRSNKRPLRFQCKFCDYKAPSTSLMQNHIYRHTDATPYACAYCGHKSTTKSTIMVHIELCHPSMEVKIIENRVREQDFYSDLNSPGLKPTLNPIEESFIKKKQNSDKYDNESIPINGVAISLTNLNEDSNDLSPISDQLHEIIETQRCSEIIADLPIDDDEQSNDLSLIPPDSDLKFMVSHKMTTALDRKSIASKESDNEDDSEYLLVYNRPKQFYGSLYEPDKQYACRLCTYTTNHRPSMEDHVFVHTNEKPYKCGYCGEEIYTRYAATYHIKYKHPGMERNFIQNKADVTKYYVNRAKKEELDQMKSIDTRRVKVPKSKEKSVDKSPITMTPPIDRVASAKVPKPTATTEKRPRNETTQPSTSTSNTTDIQTAVTSQYQMFMLWSYYLATQNPIFLSMLRQQSGEISAGLPSNPEAIRKMFETMQNLVSSSTPTEHNSEPRHKKSKPSKK